MKRFRKVVNKYLIGDNTHYFTLRNLKAADDFLRRCAQGQRLNSKATLFSTAIV